MIWCRRPYLRWPQPSFDVRRRTAAACNLLQSWVHDALPAVRASLTPATAAQVRTWPRPWHLPLIHAPCSLTTLDSIISF